jgi:hypothetical protein
MEIYENFIFKKRGKQRRKNFNVDELYVMEKDEECFS